MNSPFLNPCENFLKKSKISRQNNFFIHFFVLNKKWRKQLFCFWVCVFNAFFFFTGLVQILGTFSGVKSINCAAPNADWTVISNCAELTLIPAQLFPVGFSCAELTLIPAQWFPVGFSCGWKVVQFSTRKTGLEMTVQELKLILHTKNRLEITVQELKLILNS